MQRHDEWERLTVRHAAETGVVVDGEPAVSLELLRRHKESVVGAMVAAHEKLFAASGMDFVLGTATTSTFACALVQRACSAARMASSSRSRTAPR